MDGVFASRSSFLLSDRRPARATVSQSQVAQRHGRVVQRAAEPGFKSNASCLEDSQCGGRRKKNRATGPLPRIRLRTCSAQPERRTFRNVHPAAPADSAFALSISGDHELHRKFPQWSQTPHRESESLARRRHGERWSASAWLLTEQHFNRIAGHKDLWALATILGRAPANPTVCNKEGIA